MEYKLTLGSYECIVDVVTFNEPDGRVLYTAANAYFYTRTGSDWTPTVLPKLPPDIRDQFQQFIVECGALHTI